MRMRLFGMFALCVGHAASLTLAAGRPNLAAARVHRSALRMQEEIPSKFVRSQWGPAVSVTMPKPLGLKLVELLRHLRTLLQLQELLLLLDRLQHLGRRVDCDPRKSR